MLSVDSATVRYVVLAVERTYDLAHLLAAGARSVDPSTCVCDDSKTKTAPATGAVDSTEDLRRNLISTSSLERRWRHQACPLAGIWFCRRQGSEHAHELTQHAREGVLSCTRHVIQQQVTHSFDGSLLRLDDGIGDGVQALDEAIQINRLVVNAHLDAELRVVDLVVKGVDVALARSFAWLPPVALAPDL